MFLTVKEVLDNVIEKDGESFITGLVSIPFSEVEDSLNECDTFGIFIINAMFNKDFAPVFSAYDVESKIAGADMSRHVLIFNVSINISDIIEDLRDMSKEGL